MCGDIVAVMCHPCANPATMAKMAPFFMQDAPPTDPPAPPSGPPDVHVNVDLSGIVEGIVNGVVNGVHDLLFSWGDQLPTRVQPAITEGLTHLWDDLWHSGVNILATPEELTLLFPPAIALGARMVVILGGVAALAVVLLLLRILWRIMQGKGGVQEDVVSSILLGVILSTASWSILLVAFALCSRASDSFGRFDYSPAMWTQAAMGNFLFWGVTVGIMLFYGWRLFVRAAYRIVLLMFMSPFAPLASLLVAIPQTRWVAVLYWVTVGGWLAGGALALGALSLGVQLATIGNSNPLVSLIFSVALIQLAHDLMAWLPKSFTGSALHGSASWSDAWGPAGAAMGVGGAVAGAGVGAGAVASAASAAGSVAGALPSGADVPGLGY